MAQDGQIGRKNKWPNHQGVIMVDSVRGSLRIRKWPRSRPTVHPTVKQQMADFTQANILWRFIHPEFQKTFINAAKGTPWLPRDWFLKTLYGTAFSIVNPENGREYFSMATRQGVSDSLLALSQDPGALLTFNGTLWVPIKSASAGQVLTSQGVDQVPEWAPPAGAGDYPLTPPDAADFPTWVNQGDAVAEDGVEGLCMSASGGGADDLRLILKAMPIVATTWIVKARTTSYDGGEPRIGLCFRDSSSGRIWGAGFGWRSSSDTQRLILARWNSPTSFNSADFGQDISSGQDLYIKCVDDLTNMTFSWSVGGGAWRQMYSGSRTAWLASVDQLGFFLNPSAQTATGCITHYTQN